jgi:hypothetical protein
MTKKKRNAVRPLIACLGLAVAIVAVGVVCQRAPSPLSPSNNVSSRHQIVLEVNVDGPERWDGILLDDFREAHA